MFFNGKNVLVTGGVSFIGSHLIVDGSPVNAGREDRITINEAAEYIFELMDWRPKEIHHDLNKPQGVASRAADLSRARKTLVWEPKTSYSARAIWFSNIG